MTLRQHSVPGLSAAIAYQFYRALYWLAKSPSGFIVGIETDDDVTVIGSDGIRLQEQDKHSIVSDAKPYGDRSKDLWNTLAVWIDALDTKEVSAESTRFLMVTNKHLSECIARRIHEAKTPSQAERCIADLIAVSKNPPEGIAAQVERVLQTSSRENLLKLITSCELVDASDSSEGDNLRGSIISELQLPEWQVANADSIFDELLGWVHETAMEAWKIHRPAWIRRDHFVNRLQSSMEARKRQLCRERAESLIPVSDDSVGQKKGSLFVRQLYFVTDDDDLVDGAIREYIRCNIEKSRLSSEGSVSDDEWTAFESALFSRWKKIRARVVRMRRQSDEGDVGFEILMESTAEYREKLAGSDTEQVYLTSGTYHRLAEMAKVGWHPRFEQLILDARNKHD